MMVIQVILILAFGILLIKALTNPNSASIRAWKKILACLFAALAIFAVLFPEILDDMAHVVGVGRGADLLLYALSLAFIAYVLNQYLQAKESQKRINALARKVAILETELQAGSKKR
jgi:hypothetical protein